MEIFTSCESHFARGGRLCFSARDFRILQHSSRNTAPHPPRNSKPKMEVIALAMSQTGAAMIPHMRTKPMT